MSKITYTYGEIGQEGHAYLPYAIATAVDGKVQDLEIGDAFLPTGKILFNVSTQGINAMHMSPWYPKIGSDIKAKNYDFATIEALSLEQRHFISIDSKVFVLSVKENFLSSNLMTNNILTFRAYSANETPETIAAADYLTEQYIVDNITWYIGAINANTIYACDNKGSKRSGTVSIDGVEIDFSACPSDGAFKKNDPNSRYAGFKQLQGTNFKPAMELISKTILQQNGKPEFIKVQNGGNIVNLRLKNLNLASVIKHNDGYDVNSRYLKYHASYAKIAIKAFNIAKGLSL